MSRRDARRHAFVLIYQLEFHEHINTEEFIESYIEFLNTYDDSELEVPKNSDKDFIYTCFSGVIQNVEKLDSIISKNLTTGWEIDRINRIDLAIMRLSIYEMIFTTDVPAKVSINEAVETAKLYGTDDSFNFVNGLLGRVLRDEINK